MSVPVAVVISCAGRGSRLGLGTTKALATLCGRPLIAWQLDLLQDHCDIRIVVGFDAPRLIGEILQIRKDVLFVFNRDYLTTGTAASIAAATVGIPEGADVISLDGDLLVDPIHLSAMLRSHQPSLGVLTPTSSDPVFAIADKTNTLITGFTRDRPSSGTCYEWSGLVRLPSRLIRESKGRGADQGHVYEMLEGSLPLPFRIIDAAEIDTPQDFTRAENWLASRVSNGSWKL